MIEQTKAPIVNKAVLKLREMSADDIIKERVRVREKALHDETTALNSARSEGRAEGIAIGEKKGRAERDEQLVIKWRNMGMSEEKIKELLN